MNALLLKNGIFEACNKAWHKHDKILKWTCPIIAPSLNDWERKQGKSNTNFQGFIAMDPSLIPQKRVDHDSNLPS